MQHSRAGSGHAAQQGRERACSNDDARRVEHAATMMRVVSNTTAGRPERHERCRTCSNDDSNVDVQHRVEHPQLLHFLDFLAETPVFPPRNVDDTLSMKQPAIACPTFFPLFPSSGMPECVTFSLYSHFLEKQHGRDGVSGHRFAATSGRLPPSL